MFECAKELREVLRSSGDKQLTELAELLEMQEELDRAILKEQGITEYPINNILIALFVELGEMLNELPTLFKHWKKTAKDNREKALVEYVDTLHFAMSLTNYRAKPMVERENAKNIILYLYDYDNECHPWNIAQKTFLIKLGIQSMLDNEGMEITYLFSIGQIIGFEWDEIYKAYKDKNAVNYQRLKEGY